MGILQIRQAEREGARLVIGLAGVSGSGKTFTALRLAWGLANGDASKIGFLDTENRRGSLYSDILIGKDNAIHKFNIGDLIAPFSPQRYRDAILEFQAHGVEVLIIDSVSHEWEGIGGCQDIAENTTSKVKNWKLAKAEHKKFMNALLQSDMHVIACIRAREKVELVKELNPQTNKIELMYKPLGLQPIQESNFMFEQTASLMMHEQGARQDVLKCPSDLADILGRGVGYIGVKEGLAIRKWVDGGQKLDPAIEAAKNTLTTITEQGVEALKKAWSKMPGPVKKSLGDDFYKTLELSANEYDKNREPSSAIGDDVLDGLNAMATAPTAGTDNQDDEI